MRCSWPRISPVPSPSRPRSGAAASQPRRDRPPGGLVPAHGGPAVPERPPAAVGNRRPRTLRKRAERRPRHTAGPAARSAARRRVPAPGPARPDGARQGSGRRSLRLLPHAGRPAVPGNRGRVRQGRSGRAVHGGHPNPDPHGRRRRKRPGHDHGPGQRQAVAEQSPSHVRHADRRHHRSGHAPAALGQRGHPPPLLCVADGDIWPLAGSGPPAAYRRVFPIAAFRPACSPAICCSPIPTASRKP